MRHIGLLVIVLCVGGFASAQSAQPPLKQVAAIGLPDVQGRIDHFAADATSDHEKLFVAALENNSVEAVDLVTRKRAGSIRKLANPAGIAFIPKTGEILVANGGDGTARFFDASTLEPRGVIEDLPDADNVRFDPDHNRLFVGYGDGGLALISTGHHLLSTFKLPGHPESFQIEPRSNEGRLYINIPGAKQVCVLDWEPQGVHATWKFSEAEANFPMALDESNHRLFIGCRKPAKLLVLDTATGKTVAAVPIVGDTDDVWYDAPAKQLYLSGGEGAITIVQQQDADRYTVVDTMKTAPGARTSFYLPTRRELIVAVPHRGKQQAELRIYAR